MADYRSSTPPPPSYYARIAPPRNFLTLSPATMSTRSTALQTLIQSRGSSNNLAGLRRSSQYQSASHDEDGYDSEYDTDHGQRDDRSSFHHATDEEVAISQFPPLSRRSTVGIEALMTPQMRSMRLIGNSNPRYQWERYFKSDEALEKLSKPLRAYYERNNGLISRYLYIDRLLDSSLPHNLIQEYQRAQVDIPMTINEEPTSPIITALDGVANGSTVKVKRTPKTLYRVPTTEETPLLDGKPHKAEEYGLEGDSPIVAVAIAINFASNAVLLALKIVIIVLTSSLSVLASLVDAALDFLSTIIVWVTTRMAARRDQYAYPVGRGRLEPIGVLVFSVIMITSFAQVGLQCIQRLTNGDRSVAELTLPAIAIMVTTVLVKGACWLWCRLIKNSSVQALAQDAMTDVVFNTFSIIFPLIGFYARIWWMDALGGLVLSLYVIFNWARTSGEHIRNLSGAAAQADERNVLLYLTMRFARTIKQIQGLQAYHAGDKVICEVDIVLDEATPLRDSHDLGESLQYVLESVPYVDRAFVHMDYRSDNLPTHMDQRE